ncbi:Cytochrome P450 6A1 [Camponotus floridanus]|uniref:Cytochrome P450 6A1 n=1 Tax=Camponotus floridanus TaxID=104421 RepID=E2ARC1_CAMFO|nr:Cytochrome P450 6A1 [Camponotus floridanus]
MMGSLEMLCGIAVIFLAIYYYLTSIYDFWKSRDIRGPKPILIFGNYKDVILNKKCEADYFKDIYDEYKDESVIGIFTGVTPALIVKDLDLIKDILIKDFSKFGNKGPIVSNNTDLLSHNLAGLEHKRWRPLRIRLSPAFTSSKIKEMFPLISECADYLEQYIEKLVSKNEPIDCRELTAKYTTDVIGSCGFGIEMNALLDQDSEFRKIGKMIFLPTWSNILRYRIKQIFPWLDKMLSYIIPNIIQTEVNRFFVRFVTEIMNYRETNNVIRHDFIDILREIKKNSDKVGDIKVSENFIAAQAFIFFFAGFETSSTTMSNTLYELALNQQIQDKLREEINQAYTKHGSNLSYENVKEMNYLDKVFKETLRKYPTVSYLIRQSTTSYTFGGSTLDIPKNLQVFIPVFGIHRDPDIYPKPDVFDPERFSDEAIQTRHPMHYLPFGDGPRNCIGARFAIHQTKIGLIKILRNYKVEICDKTEIPYINDPKSFILLTPKNGIHLRIIKIKL